MKILIISYIFPPWSTAVGTVMYNLCKYLPKKYYKVITTPRELFLRKGTYDKNYILNCEVIRLPSYGYRIYHRLVFVLLTVFNGLLLNKKEKFDCIYAVYPFNCDLFGAYILHRLLRKPLVIHMHDLFSEQKKKEYLYKLWLFLENKMFLDSSHILVTNEKFKNHYIKRGIKNVVIIPHSIELNNTDYNIISFKEQLNEKMLNIVFTGSVNVYNEDSVISLLETIKNLSDIKVIFATVAKQEFLKDVSIGFLSKNECIALQRNADILFLPLSFNSEFTEEIMCAFPCKLLEYLAAGKAILAVVPRGSFSADFIIKHKIGIVVTEASPKLIKDAIKNLRDENTRKEYSKNALDLVKLFDSKIISKQLCDLLNNIEMLDYRARDEL